MLIPILLYCKRASILSPTVSRLRHLKLECSVKRSAVIGSYNIQSSQSQRGCVASASKIPSEYTSSVASTKNDNALTWPAIQFEMKNSCTIRFYIGCIFIDRAELDRSDPFYLLRWYTLYFYSAIWLKRHVLWQKKQFLFWEVFMDDIKLIDIAFRHNTSAYDVINLVGMFRALRIRYK